MGEELKIAMFGHKRWSREGGVEIVVKELCTRMALQGNKVTCYNRSGHHVSGAEYDDIDKTEYEGIIQKYVPTIERKGDMSIIGTRPPLISETNLYELHHRARLAIKPGITGMWQVSGRSDITDFEEVVRLDKEYITNWNIGLDIKILFKTVLVVFKKDGSM